MRNTVRLLAAILLLAAASSHAALHRMLRCDGGIITVGMDKFTVIAKCGMPIVTDEVTGGGAKIRVERLLYRLSTQAPLKVVTIRGGKVIDIESLD